MKLTVAQEKKENVPMLPRGAEETGEPVGKLVVAFTKRIALDTEREG